MGWVEWSLRTYPSEHEAIFRDVNYSIIGFCVLVLMHSAWLNRWRWRVVRFCTDLSCVASIALSACVLRCTSGCSVLEGDIYLNMLAYTCFGSIVQGCDNYITYARYEVVMGDRVTSTQKWLTLLYVIVTLYMPWILFFTIVPAFTNTNHLYFDTFVPLQVYLYFPAYVAYNFCHTVLLLQEISRKSGDVSETANKIRLQAFRSITHDLISIASITCYTFIPIWGPSIQNVLTIIGLHCVFNWKGPGRSVVRSPDDRVIPHQVSASFAYIQTVDEEHSKNRHTFQLEVEPPVVCRMVDGGFEEKGSRLV